MALTPSVRKSLIAVDENAVSRRLHFGYDLTSSYLSAPRLLSEGTSLSVLVVFAHESDKVNFNATASAALLAGATESFGTSHSSDSWDVVYFDGCSVGFHKVTVEDDCPLNLAVDVVLVEDTDALRENDSLRTKVSEVLSKSGEDLPLCVFHTLRATPERDGFYFLGGLVFDADRTEVELT